MIEEISLFDPLDPGFHGQGRLVGLAVDSAGNFYVGKEAALSAVRKYDPAGNCLDCPEGFNKSFNIQSLGVDEAGNVYVGDVTDLRIAEYDSSGLQSGLIRAIYGEAPCGAISVFPSSNAGGDIFAVCRGEILEPPRVVRISLPPPGPAVVAWPGETVADPVANTRATVNASINPEGKATTYHVDYVDEATYQADIAAEGPGHGFDHAASTLESASIGEGFTLTKISKEIGCTDAINEEPEECLQPETKYRFRVVAQNADSPPTEPSIVEGEPFTTKPPLEIEVFATKVGAGSARLNVTVDPLGIPATGYLEYVDDAAFRVSGFATATRIPTSAQAELDFGAAGPQTRTVQLTSLSPGTVYHFRAFAGDSLISTPIESEQRTFRTYPVPKPQGPVPTTSCAMASRPRCPTAAPMRWSPRSTKPAATSPAQVRAGRRPRPPRPERRRACPPRAPGSPTPPTAPSARRKAPPSRASTWPAAIPRRPRGRWANEPISTPQEGDPSPHNADAKLRPRLQSSSAPTSPAAGWRPTEPELDPGAGRGLCQPLPARPPERGLRSLHDEPARRPARNRIRARSAGGLRRREAGGLPRRRRSPPKAARQSG